MMIVNAMNDPWRRQRNEDDDSDDDDSNDPVATANDANDVD